MLSVIDCLWSEASLMAKNSRSTLDIFSSLFLLAFAVFIVIESCHLGLGEWNNPGAGYFSLGASILLGVVSLAVFVKGLRKRSGKEEAVSDPEPLQSKNVVFVLGGVIVYTLLFDKAGFILSTFLMITFFLRCVFPQRWLVTLSTAFCCAIGSYLLFNVLLGAELPKGVLGF
jgi:putative tricarboxylic transport membrane protein